MDEASTEFKKQQSRLADGLKVAISAWAEPGNPVPNMISALGYEVAMKMLLLFGGQNVEFPKLSELSGFVNIASASRAVEDGGEIKSVAKNFGVDEDELMRVCKKLKKLRSLERATVSKRTELLRKTGLI